MSLREKETQNKEDVLVPFKQIFLFCAGKCLFPVNDIEVSILLKSYFSSICGLIPVKIRTVFKVSFEKYKS